MTISREKIVTRFAPSPTGALHVGGARTAMFCWAFARQHGNDGAFVLRMEDTDQVRSSDASTLSIIEDLQWLGLDWNDGPRPGVANPKENQLGEYGPYFQSQRLEIYQKYVDQLLASGQAYYCYKTQEEIAHAKAAAREAGKSEKYDPTEMMNLSAEQAAKYEAEGRVKVVRFHMPDEEVVIDDLVLGQVRVGPEALEDFVIVKSDGFPTYHFAVVVDDYLMGVNYVLRGQEHLNNTPKHVALQAALGFDRPHYAHIPLIFNIDGSKMSKRDKVKAARAAGKQWVKSDGNSVASLAAASGVDEALLERMLAKKVDDNAVAQAIAKVIGCPLPEIEVADFRASGYLPGALCNYLARLGWSPKGDEEQFDNAFLVREFSIDRIGKSNAKFDREKLLNFNGDAIREMPTEEFVKTWREYCQVYRKDFYDAVSEADFTLLADSYQERAGTLAGACELAKFFVTADDAIEYDPKAVKKNLAKNEAAGYQQLEKLGELLSGIDDWTSTVIEQTLKSYMDDNGLGMGQVFQPIRIAVTGSTMSPPIPDTLVILGKKKTLKRIAYCIEAREI